MALLARNTCHSDALPSQMRDDGRPRSRGWRGVGLGLRPFAARLASSVGMKCADSLTSVTRPRANQHDDHSSLALWRVFLLVR